MTPAEKPDPAALAQPPLAPPSDWLLAHREALVEATALGPILDLACGRGRHARACAQWGLPVVAIDRNSDALRALSPPPPIARIRCDLEDGNGIPLQPGTCGAILVFRFLYRPLCAEIEAALAPGGLLLYETFTRGQLELAGGPRSPAFLLEAGELAGLFPGLEAIESEEGVWGRDRPLALARLLARKPALAKPGAEP